MEFLIKAVEGTTAGSLCTLGKGDKVELSQVMGSGFKMDQVAPAEDYPTILLFATGSGIRYFSSLTVELRSLLRRDLKESFGF